MDEPLSLLRETAGVQFGLPAKNPFQKTKGESNMKSSPVLGALLLYSFQVLGQLWYIRWWLVARIPTKHLVIGCCHI